MPWVALDPPPLCLISLPLLNWILPPTVRDIVVPRLSGERFISGGHPPDRTCVPGLFHAWSLLLAAACVALRFTAFTVLQGGVRGHCVRHCAGPTLRVSPPAV